MLDISKCKLCPRECGVDRRVEEKGICGEGAAARVARVGLHPYEEPCICGEKGAGTIFFCGCSLGCVYCQNRAISRESDKGEIYSAERLADAMIELERMGAASIDLVTPTHFAHVVKRALEIAKPRLHIPIVYNTSGYEKVETLAELEGLVDIYMPDFKYCSPEIAEKYSAAGDYGSVAERALAEMYRQVGACEYEDDGILKKGIIVRHLVLPSCRKDSVAVLERIAKTVPVKDILISLMSQYTPDFAFDSKFKELHRKITKFEYETVVNCARELNFDGFVQSIESAKKAYTPDF